MSNKFKVGDRVRFNWQPQYTDSKGGTYAKINGHVGVVTRVSCIDSIPYTVRFASNVAASPITAIAEAELTLETPTYTLEGARELVRVATEAVAKAQAIIDELEVSLKPETKVDFDSLGIGASLTYPGVVPSVTYVVTKLSDTQWQNSWVYSGSGKIGNTPWSDADVRSHYAENPSTFKLITKGIQS